MNWNRDIELTYLIAMSRKLASRYSWFEHKRKIAIDLHIISVLRFPNAPGASIHQRKVKPNVRPRVHLSWIYLKQRSRCRERQQCLSAVGWEGLTSASGAGLMKNHSLVCKHHGGHRVWAIKIFFDERPQRASVLAPLVSLFVLCCFVFSLAPTSHTN